MKIGFDVDGVLADFNIPYMRLLENCTNKHFPPGYVPRQWNYAREYEFTRAEEGRAWDMIKLSDCFWYELPLMGKDPLLLSRIDPKAHDVYFVTDRPGRSAKAQTEDWLYFRCGVGVATVCISEHKGTMCAALGIEAYIDDKPENIESVLLLSPSTRAYLLTQPWNAQMDTKGRRVASLKEFLLAEGLVDA